MDLSFGIGFALPIALGLAALGSGMGLGRAVEGATSAMGRQPEAAGKIQLAMLLGCAFIEALTIYALVVYIMGAPMAKQEIEAARAVGMANAAAQASYQTSAASAEKLGFDLSAAESEGQPLPGGR